MNSFTINMQNFTQAQKARMLLAGKGIRSTVLRTSRRGQACSFALRIYQQRDMACAVLAAAGIPCDLP